MRLLNVRLMTAKYRLSVFGEKGEIGQCCVVGNTQHLSDVGAEVLGDGPLRQCVAKSLGQHKPQFIVEGDQPAVKGSIVDSGEGKPIAHVQPFGRIFAPRQDVGGYQKFSNGKPGYAAAAAEIVQNRVSEVVLTSPLFGCGEGLGRANGRTLVQYDSNRRLDFDFVVVVDREKLAKRFFAGRYGFLERRVELGPGTAIQRARTFQPFDPSRLQSRIQGRKVAQLHGDTAGGAPESRGEHCDRRVLLVELRKSELVVEIQRDEQLITGPFSSGGGGHGTMIGGFVNAARVRNL